MQTLLGDEPPLPPDNALKEPSSTIKPELSKLMEVLAPYWPGCFSEGTDPAAFEQQWALHCASQGMKRLHFREARRKQSRQRHASLQDNVVQTAADTSASGE